MRLTNVSHLRLPFGRLYGYDVEAGPPERRLPISFDQRRHVSAGSRPGSWMALSLQLPGDVDRDDLASAWWAVMERHGTLRSAFSTDESGELALGEIALLSGRWREHPIAQGQAVNDALREVLDEACTPFARPSHRLCVLETAAGSTVIIGADHAHVDMWSMLVIARDLLSALAAISSGVAPALDAAPEFAEHTAALSEPGPPPPEVSRRWREILEAGDGFMPRFPLPLGEAAAHLERVEVRDVFDVHSSAAFSAQARADGVSTLTLALSAMAEVTRTVSGAPLRAVFPVHGRFEEKWNDAVGWVITTSVLEVTDPAPQATSRSVREAIELGSHPLAEVLAPWGGMPEAPGMFAISWLDLRRLPVRIDSTGLDAQYVGATIRTDGVMLWFILDENGLHLRCRYPDTEEARANVGGWLDALVARMQDIAAHSVGDVLDVDGEQFRVSRAKRADVPAILDLLGEEMPSTEVRDRLHAAITRDRSHYLAVVRDASGAVVGTMELTFVPGFSQGGTLRLEVAGFRAITSDIGAAMLRWVHEQGINRGADLTQMTTEVDRELVTDLGYTPEQGRFVLRLSDDSDG